MIFHVPFWQGFSAAAASVCFGLFLCHFAGFYSWNRPKGGCRAGGRSRPARADVPFSDGNRDGGERNQSEGNASGYCPVSFRGSSIFALAERKNQIAPANAASAPRCADKLLHVGARGDGGGNLPCNGVADSGHAIPSLIFERVFVLWRKLIHKRYWRRTNESLHPVWQPGAATGIGGRPAVPRQERCPLKLKT
jgi:hypothetical protein